MKKFYLIIILSVMICMRSNAQQMYHFSLFNDNAWVINPALTGLKPESVVSASFRKQWTSIRKSPLTGFVGWNSSYPKKNIGFGAYVYDDETGPNALTGFTGIISYHIKLGESYYQFHKDHGPKTLSFGLGISAVYYRLNLRNAIIDNPEDPILSQNLGQKVFPDASFGVHFDMGNFFVGASIPQLLNLNLRYKTDSKISDIKKMQHYYLNMGGRVYFKNDEFNVIPTVWLKYVVGGYPQGQVNVRVNWIDKGYAGMSYRSIHTLSWELGAIIKKKVQIGYAFDLDISRFLGSLGTTHEAFISYKFVPKYQK